MSADWGCAGAQTGAAQGRRLGLRRGTGWGCAGAQTGATQGRRLGLRRGADWGCAGAQTGAAHERRLGQRRVADWGCAGAQTGAVQGRRLGLRMGADWGSAGSQTGAAQGRRLGLRSAVQEGGGGRLTTGFWRPPQAPGSSPGGYWGPGQRVREGLTTGFWPRAVGGGARRGAVQAGSPRGWLSCAWPQASRGCFLRGSCRFMAQGAWGRVPTLAPGGSCWLSLGGGGGMRFRVFWEASYLPWQNPGGLFALGNLRGGQGLGQWQEQGQLQGQGQGWGPW